MHILTFQTSNASLRSPADHETTRCMRRWGSNTSMSAPPPLAGAGDHRTRLFHTSFYWGKDAQVLFHGWPGSSAGMYAAAVVFVFAMAVAVELLTHLAKFFKTKPGSNRFAVCMFQTGLYAVRSGLAYFVVLALTSFNGGIFLAAVLGHAVGYSVFRSGICLSVEG